MRVCPRPLARASACPSPRGLSARSPFRGAGRFLWDRHGIFRQRLSHAAEPTKPGRWRRAGWTRCALRRRACRARGMFLQELHGHHQIEITTNFPVLGPAGAAAGTRLRPARRGSPRARTDWLAASREAANAVLTGRARPGAGARAGRFATGDEPISRRCWSATWKTRRTLCYRSCWPISERGE